MDFNARDEPELEGTKALAKIRPTQYSYLIRKLPKIPRRQGLFPNHKGACIRGLKRFDKQAVLEIKNFMEQLRILETSLLKVSEFALIEPAS